MPTAAIAPVAQDEGECRRDVDEDDPRIKVQCSTLPDRILATSMGRFGEPRATG